MSKNKCYKRKRFNCWRMISDRLPTNLELQTPSVIAEKKVYWDQVVR